MQEIINPEEEAKQTPNKVLNEENKGTKNKNLNL
jgi:hypothetical protein